MMGNHVTEGKKVWPPAKNDHFQNIRLTATPRSIIIIVVVVVADAAVFAVVSERICS